MTDRSEFSDDQRRSLFGSHAQTYDDGRPGYPSALFEHLRSSLGLVPGSCVLEVGPGAGQATGPLLDAGAEVVGVELGGELASLLRDRFDGRPLDVRLGEFESVDVSAESFDLVVSATAFHWIAPDVGLARAARALRPGGVLALWWNHYGDADRPDPFRDAVQPILEQHLPQFTDAVSGGSGIGAHPYALDAEARVGEIDASGHFGPVDQIVFAWTARQTGDDVQRFLRSFSGWMALDSDVRDRALGAIGDLVDDAFGGAIDRPFLTALYAARRH